MSNIAKRVPKTSGKSTSTYADSSFVVQVTTNEVLLIDVDQSLGIPVIIGKPWTPRSVEAWQDKQIVAASINASQIMLALSGGVLVLLNLDQNDRLHLQA
jgi:DNA damage-binding protein 1